jgi:hypothetical protein
MEGNLMEQWKSHLMEGHLMQQKDHIMKRHLHRYPIQREGYPNQIQREMEGAYPDAQHNSHQEHQGGIREYLLIYPYPVYTRSAR